jgi:hypothetical protein
MKWTRSIAFWIPFACAAYLSWLMLENPESGWVAFYSFLPMTFLFVGFAFIVVSKRMQALEARIRAIEGGGPPLDTTGDSADLQHRRFAPLGVGGILVLVAIGGGLHGDLTRQVLLSSAYSAIVIVTLLRWILYRCPHCHQRFFIAVVKGQHLPLRRFIENQCANCGHALHKTI